MAAAPRGSSLDRELNANKLEFTVIDQWVTVKILDIEKFYNDIKPCLYECFGEKYISKLNIKEHENKYIISYDKKELIVNSRVDITKIIFGDTVDFVDKLPDSKVKVVLKEIFPIPFINIYGMNYQ